MKLQHIELEHLKQTTLNVRKHGGEDVDDLIASIQTLGIIQPLLVRPNCEGFEVIAGGRRLRACQALAAKGGFNLGLIPCAIMEDGDDALAIEASLAENTARLPMDEIDQYEAFAALVAQGRSTEEIAASFGVSERMVRQRLAIAQLYKPVLKAYRKDEIDGQTMRCLTLATKRQQQHWYKLFRGNEAYAPSGHALKAWLFGGADIATSAALFPLENYTSAIKSDLFGEEQYFTDPNKFWELQNTSIAEKAAAYRNAGWSDVVVLDIGQHFYGYDMVRRDKDDGGKVFVICATNGEVEFREGWLDAKDAKKLDRERAKVDGTYEPHIRTELTKAAQTNLDLHRHAAVRAELLEHPAVALRLFVAHAIAGSRLWSLKPEMQSTGGNEQISECLVEAKAQKAFAKQRKAILKLLHIDDERSHLIANDWQGGSVAPLFETLTALSDKQVMRALAFTMAETLASGTEIIDMLGAQLKVDLAGWWQPDETFFNLLRDKQAINAILGEVAGKTVADANIASTAKVQKDIIKDCQSGTGREKVEGWMPRYMAFPMAGYTERFA